MESGTVVGGEIEGNKEKQRYTESKVYTRKAFKGPKKNNNAAQTTTTSTNADNNASFTANTANNNEDNNNSKDCGVDNDGNKNYDSIPQENDLIPQALSTGEVDSSLQQVVPRLDMRADDTSSLNRQQEVAPVVCEQHSGNVAMKEGSEDPWKVNVPSSSKNEVRELRMKLEGELDLVRSLAEKVEEKRRLIDGVRVSGSSGRVVVSHSCVPLNYGFNHGVKRTHSNVTSAGVPVDRVTPRQSRSVNQLSILTREDSQGAVEYAEKEKRTPKANQLYRNSEFLLAKDKFPPAESNKKGKLNAKKRRGGEVGHGFRRGSKVFKRCGALLERLMKHKHSWVFNTPVDVKSLGLHDYFTIIKCPMDLGTVKSKLNKNWYKSPKEFADDVRLTFSNAMTYNPKGQDVHIMAEELSKMFEDKWAVIESDYTREMRRLFSIDYAMAIHTPTSRKAPPFWPSPLDMRRILDRSESMTHPLPLPSVRTPASKKPKAKDPHKRDMTYEEKQKLSTNLQSLPSEKLDNIVQIIKKRNSTLFQQNDEIEVDIDSVDAETLWELDRFVTNYKKSLSKNKRKAELAMQARAEAEQNVQQQLPAPVVVETPKEVEIADARNVSSSLPVEEEKGGDNTSRSSSSSSSSSDSGSSSSDSDSDSSSASESDKGHSPRS